MSTNNGLSAFDPAKETFKNFSAADGLPGPDMTGWGLSEMKNRSGRMIWPDCACRERSEQPRRGIRPGATAAAYLERIRCHPPPRAEFQNDLTPVDLRYLGLPK